MQLSKASKHHVDVLTYQIPMLVIGVPARTICRSPYQSDVHHLAHPAFWPSRNYVFGLMTDRPKARSVGHTTLRPFVTMGASMLVGLLIPSGPGDMDVMVGMLQEQSPTPWTLHIS